MRLFRFLPIACLAALSAQSETPPTVQEAQAFIEKAEARLLELANEASRANWIQSTYITSDTEALAAEANQRAIDATVVLAKQSTRFDKLQLPPDVARKMKLLKLALTLASPGNEKESAELTRIVTGMESTYGK